MVRYSGTLFFLLMWEKYELSAKKFVSKLYLLSIDTITDKFTL